MLWSCPILQETLIKVVHHPIIRIRIGHCQYQVSLIRNTAGIEGGDTGASTSACLLIAFGTDGACVVTAIHVHAHVSAAKVIPDCLVPDEEILDWPGDNVAGAHIGAGHSTKITHVSAAAVIVVIIIVVTMFLGVVSEERSFVEGESILGKGEAG
jgi:hypothetical protein